MFEKWNTYDYDCPVTLDTQVEVIDVGGFKRVGRAGNFYWFYQGWRTDIAQYRVIEQYPANVC